MTIDRSAYLNKIINAKNNGLIKIITGIRRCGKSYLLNNMFYEHLLNTGVKYDHIISIQFDSRDFISLRDVDNALEYIKGKIVDDDMYYILLDEVQLIKDSLNPKSKYAFFEVLNTLLHIKNCDIYATGSNSEFLSKDIHTTFRGRDYQINIHPLNFKEFYNAKKIESPSISYDDAWKEYYTYGGLPLILNMKSPKEKRDYLKGLFKEIYEKDIVERFKIDDEIEFEEILDVASSQVGSFCSYSSLAKTYKSIKNKDITDKKIKKYYSYLEDSFLLSRAQKYDIKGKKYINNLSKYYFEDPGLRNARLGFRQIEESHLMENILYNELITRGFEISVGNVLVKVKKPGKENTFMYKSLEVDFVCEDEPNRYYIQSAQEMPSKEKLAQEKESLVSIKDNFAKLIITKDNVPLIKDNDGITIINIFDFLLNPNSLSEI